MMNKKTPLHRVSGAMLVLALLSLNAYGQTASTSGAAPTPVLPADELDKLVAPIALYPDVLVAQVLPASTYPVEIVQAARWLRSNPDMSDLVQKSWAPSVLALCRYPKVLYQLDNDLDWTAAVGAAFLAQTEGVMTAIQRLRRRAGIAGTLQSNEQQTIVFEKETIRIVPAQSDVVYVPLYNPQVVYVEVDDEDSVSVGTAAAASAVSFGAGLALGAWLDTDCDWHHGHVSYCQPGYWGGWRHAGVVRYDDDWVAARGRYRGFVAGDDRGAYVGPRGAAVWGDDGRGAVWRRPTAYGAPVYTGRYASYNRRYGANYNRAANINTQVNRGPVVAGNEVNVGRRNAYSDRGDRTARRGSDRTGIRTGAGASPGTGRRAGDGSRSRGAFGDTRDRSESSRYSRRGQDSRGQAGSSSGTRDPRYGSQRSSASSSRGRRDASQRGARSGYSRSSGSGARSSSGRRSSFSDSRGSRQVNRHSSRGSSSRRSAGARRGGGRPR